ncbi:hypothetical protein V1286_002842 [Bradyrhizobium algeriense]|uniref:ATPase AAA-type core domain-containing protein n=1 Tax=Bradyrhizobium algeriense TaxID=634784 RepID=A0ABU8B9V0_9BRAD
MDIQTGGKTFSNLSKINVLLGKNGSGKSTLLRIFDQNKDALPNVGGARYVSPERGGLLAYQGGIETQLVGSPEWGATTRRQNRYDNFTIISGK